LQQDGKLLGAEAVGEGLRELLRARGALGVDDLAAGLGEGEDSAPAVFWVGAAGDEPATFQAAAVTPIACGLT
jgi:hypothetical protein